MPIDGASDAQIWQALHNLTTEARKARELRNDLRVSALHMSMNGLLGGLQARANG